MFAGTSALFRDFSFQSLIGVLGNWFLLAAFVLYVAGLWKLFQKSGVKSWKALIPGLREYELSRCAGREPEGRVLSVMAVLTILVSLIPSLGNFTFSGDDPEAAFDQAMHLFLIVTVISIPSMMVEIIYRLRVWAAWWKSTA